MDIMTAGMHFPGGFGFVGNFVDFLNGQRIHIGPDAYRFPRKSTPKECDDTSPGDFPLHFQTQFFHMVSDETRRRPVAPGRRRP